MGVEVAGEAVMDWAEEVEVTLLSRVVIHLADSQSVASVRNSGGCEYFPLVDFLVCRDDGRFRDPDFGHHGNFRDRDERHHRHFFNDFDFVAFGFPDWWYPD